MAICKNGHSISLLTEGYPRIGFQTYSRIIGSGLKGTCISRLHPDFVSQKYGLDANDCYWLSGCKGKGILSPRMLSQIVKVIKAAVSEGGKKVIFFDGLEYLLLYNDLAKVLGFLSEVDGVLARSEAEMVVSIDPQTFEDKDLVRLSGAYPGCGPEEMMTSLLIQRPQQNASAAPMSVGQTT